MIEVAIPQGEHDKEHKHLIQGGIEGEGNTTLWDEKKIYIPS